MKNCENHEKELKRLKEQSKILAVQNENQNKTLNRLIDEISEMNDKLEEAMPTVREINKIRDAWTVGSILGGWMVKFVIGVGIILSAIYAFREWIKKP